MYKNQKQTGNEQTQTHKDHNKKPLSGLIKSRFISILILSACLSVTAISGAYYLGLSLTDADIITASAIALSVLSLLLWTLSTVYAPLTRNYFITAFSAVIWWVCFFSYLAFYIVNSTDVFGNSAIEFILLLFAFPAISYMSIAEGLAISSVTVNAFIMLGVALAFAAANTVLGICGSICGWHGYSTAKTSDASVNKKG